MFIYDDVAGISTVRRLELLQFFIIFRNINILYQKYEKRIAKNVIIWYNDSVQNY